MNKTKMLLSALLLAAVPLFFSCGSTDADETVLSTVEANHIRVDVTKSNVKITLTKSEGEEIDTIDVAEVPNGSLTSVAMTQPSVSFIWPFAEPGKEYTLTAKIYAKDNYQEETVSFKTENDIASIIKYSEDYDYSVISLIAKSNQRLLKIDTSFDTISSIISKANPQNTKLLISVYSGKHYKASEKDAVLVGTIKRDFAKAALEPYANGLDIIEKSYLFSLTPSQMNSQLSSKMTYFALATLQFTLPDTPEGIVFTAKGIYSNDTIYTPIKAADLPEDKSDSAGDAK